MKRLQEPVDEKWSFEARAFLSGVIREVEKPAAVILLLHGFNERGRRILRKLLPYLPEDTLILAPDGPFPIPRTSEGRRELGHAWYFYDNQEKKYYVNQDLARSWLRSLLTMKSLLDLPLIIIGFSQGGYLAPMLGMDLPNTRLVMGIGCEFKDYLIKGFCQFPLEAIHGADDPVVSPEDARGEVEKLRSKGISCGWHSIPGLGHEISQAVGMKIKELLVEHGKRSLQG